MNVKEMRASRQKALYYLAGSLAFVILGFVLRSTEKDKDSLGVLLGILFFGFGSVIFAWQVIRPVRMVLDNEGFTLLGGFSWSPQKVRWMDIQEFVVYRNRNKCFVGYNYRPGVVRETPLSRLSRRMGAEKIISGFWSQPAEIMVAELNGYRSVSVG